MAEKLIKWNNPVDLTIEEYGRLGDVVGSLVIAQFDDQEEYREVIHELFRGWLQNEEVSC